MIYPVGSLYWSSNSTNPAELFGVGTWTQIKDRFVWAKGDNDTINGTGGEKTHTLTATEMPYHRHSFSGSQSHSHSLSKGGSIIATAVTSGAEVTGGFDSGSWWAGQTKATNSIASATVTISGNTGYTGSGGAHNNMPPYIVKYCWERTA